MRKNIFVFFVFLLTVIFIIGCSKKEDKKESGSDAEQEISISVQAEEAWANYYRDAVKRVEKKYPNAKIEVKVISSFDHLDIIDATDVSNKDVADVFAIPADRIYSMANKEALAFLDAKTMSKEIGGWSNFDAGIGGNLKVNGNYLAFPFNIETLINFVNISNAKANNIDIGKPLELTEVKNPQTILLPIFDAWFGVAFTNSAGIELLGKTSDGQLFSDMTKEWSELKSEHKQAIEALYKYWKLNFDANTTLFDQEAGWGYIDDCFSSGNKGVIRLGGPWDTAGNSQKTNEGKDMDVYPVTHITVAGRPLLHWQGGWGLAVNSRIEGKDGEMKIATELIKEIVNPEYAVDLFKATGKILENVSADVYKNSDLREIDKKVITAVINSYKNSPARPLFQEWGKVWDTWKTAVLSWNSVKPKSPEEAYKEIKASFDAMMSNF